MKKIQDDQVIHDQREMEAYLQDFTIRGFGGTDFVRHLPMWISF